MPKCLVLRRAAGVCLCLVAPDGAIAQEALPEIVAISPSPIAPPPAGSGGDLPSGVLPVVIDTFAPVTVVPRSELVRVQPRTLGDALFDRPGISGTTYAPGAANRPIIRGLDSYRVRLQENGIGAQDVSPLGEDHAVPINPVVQNRLEVIRGPATLRYGSGAIGGVVSAENGRVPTGLPVGGYAAQLLAGYTSIDAGANGAATIDAGDGPVAIHLDGFKTRNGDYGTPRGRQFNSAADSQGGAIGASLVGPNGFVGISGSYVGSVYRIPGGEAAATRTRLDPSQRKVLARGEIRFDAGPIEALRFWLGGSTYRHNELGIDPGTGIDGVRATFKNREFEGRVEAQHAAWTLPFGVLTGAAGVQAGRVKLGTSGEAGGLLAPTDSRSLAGYLFEQLDLGTGLRLQAAGRVERSRATGTPLLFPSDYLPAFSSTGDVDPAGNPVLAPENPPPVDRRRRFTPISASLGALQALPLGFVGSLTGQYVERAPAAPELYSRGAHDATATFEIGDPNLKLERARSIEVGFRRAEGTFRLDATGYYTRYTGFIYKRLTGTLCGDDFASCGQETELRQVVYSQANATFHGAEIGAQLDVLPVRSGFIGLDAQYDFVRARFDDGTAVPRIPPHRVGAGLFWREAGWFARIGTLHAFDHVSIAPYETPTRGWTNLKAELSYTKLLDRRETGLSELTLGIRADNLLDAEMRNSASFKRDEVLLPGRSARLFIGARF